ncbi:hypothetical protein FD25_GL000570 [Levilactobacillus acidifarinae DSM 19394]|uniref:WxL domain-containing protein n=1 Tax=Levilactobacillus acidifarinae DSM 19394 = JCM 15949 TaxID=1423715 RepID=A0A0R1LGM4_9LACO|nr:hypothetical protein FD25_GL000570 [Levilactobacillus acidifarinae DSM 19394]
MSHLWNDLLSGLNHLTHLDQKSRKKYEDQAHRAKSQEELDAVLEAAKNEDAQQAASTGNASQPSQEPSNAITAPDLKFVSGPAATTQRLTNGVSSQLTITTTTQATWVVSVQLGAFKSQQGHILTGAKLQLRTDQSAKAPVLTAGEKNVLFSMTTGPGSHTTDLKDSTLTLPSAVYAGTYQASLYYTLTAGPQT